MQKEEIVRRFFEKGHLLTPEILALLESTEPGYDSESNSVVIEKLQPRGQERQSKDVYRIIKNLTEKPAEVKTEDFIRFYVSKYEKMKAIITERVQQDFVSLNKIDNFRNEIHVMGIAKEIKRADKWIVELEDLTASVPVVFDEQPPVELDDAVAIKAVGAGRVLYGKKIIYPDIPIRQPATGSGTACFISDLHLDETAKGDQERFFSWLESKNIPYLLVAGDIGNTHTMEELVDKYCFNKTVFAIPGNVDTDKEYPQLPENFSSKNIVSLSNPSMIELNGIKILLVHHGGVEMLKKRHLGKSKLILPEDFLALEEIPDIVHCGHTHEPYVMNYKSVSIVNSGSLLSDFRPVVVDFATRNVEQVSLKV